jgi:hypothetical protein
MRKISCIWKINFHYEERYLFTVEYESNDINQHLNYIEASSTKDLIKKISTFLDESKLNKKF